MTENLVFLTGIARGGTSLVGRMLDAHPQASIAIDAYLPIFRSFRNAAMRAQLGDAFDPSMPLQDGHFSGERRQWLEIVLGADLALPIDDDERDDLTQRFRDRASDETADIVPHIKRLETNTYATLIPEALEALARARGGEATHMGVKDLWIVDQFPALAKAYPNARFVLIVRDPRAVVASVHGYRPIDPYQCGHTLSILRHWRKALACRAAF